MDSVMDMVMGQVKGKVLDQMGSEAGVDSSAAEKAVSVGLPMILGGLGRNTEDPAGAESLEKALKKDHDGSLLDNLGDAVGKQEVAVDGGKILGHIFGDRQESVEKAVGKSADIDGGASSKLMSMLAPIVMGQLGKQVKDGNLSIGDLTDLLGGEKKKSDSMLGSIGARLLDRDGDGEFTDDLLDIAKGLFGGKK